MRRSLFLAVLLTNMLTILWGCTAFINEGNVNDMTPNESACQVRVPSFFETAHEAGNIYIGIIVEIDDAPIKIEYINTDNYTHTVEFLTLSIKVQETLKGGYKVDTIISELIPVKYKELLISDSKFVFCIEDYYDNHFPDILYNPFHAMKIDNEDHIEILYYDGLSPLGFPASGFFSRVPYEMRRDLKSEYDFKSNPDTLQDVRNIVRYSELYPWA